MTLRKKEYGRTCGEKDRVKMPMTQVEAEIKISVVPRPYFPMPTLSLYLTTHEIPAGV